MKLLCVFSAVSCPVEQHTKLADQPGGSPCYSSYFVASNMYFGERPGLDFNKQVEFVFSTMRASTVLLFSSCWLGGHILLWLFSDILFSMSLRSTHVAIFVLY